MKALVTHTDNAYQWLCQQRRLHPPNADIWHLRFLEATTNAIGVPIMFWGRWGYNSDLAQYYKKVNRVSSKSHEPQSAVISLTGGE